MQLSKASGRSWRFLREVLICNQYAQAIIRKKRLDVGAGGGGIAQVPSKHSDFHFLRNFQAHSIPIPFLGGTFGYSE